MDDCFTLISPRLKSDLYSIIWKISGVPGINKYNISLLPKKSIPI